jgi:hypothetical protein
MPGGAQEAQPKPPLSSRCPNRDKNYEITNRKHKRYFDHDVRAVQRRGHAA